MNRRAAGTAVARAAAGPAGASRSGDLAGPGQANQQWLSIQSLSHWQVSIQVQESSDPGMLRAAAGTVLRLVPAAALSSHGYLKPGRHRRRAAAAAIV